MSASLLLALWTVLDARMALHSAAVVERMADGGDGVGELRGPGEFAAVWFAYCDAKNDLYDLGIQPFALALPR